MFAMLIQPRTYVKYFVYFYIICTKCDGFTLNNKPRNANSLSGPLCAYLMRQNLHNQIHQKS